MLPSLSKLVVSHLDTEEVFYVLEHFFIYRRAREIRTSTEFTRGIVADSVTTKTAASVVDGVPTAVRASENPCGTQKNRENAKTTDAASRDHNSAAVHSTVE